LSPTIIQIKTFRSLLTWLTIKADPEKTEFIIQNRLNISCEAQDHHHRSQGARCGLQVGISCWVAQWISGLPGFDANNLTEDKIRVVDIVIDGKESQVEAFKEYAEAKKPSGAEISSINISDYDGDVMRMVECAQVLTALLLIKENLMIDSNDPSKRIK